MNINHSFDSFQAFVTHAITTPSFLSADQRSSRAEGRRDFTGTSTWEEAIKLAQEGWPEGLARIEAMRGVLYQHVGERVVRPEISYSVVGEVIDMGRLMTGEPECMMVWEENEIITQASGKVVRIVVNVSASWMVDKEVLFVRGAALCALIDALESAGRRCEVTVATCNGGGSGNQGQMVSRIMIKRADDALQPEQLAFALCHASMLRRLIFSLWETIPRSALRGYHVGRGKGYGSVEEFPGDRGDLYLPAAHGRDSHWDSIEQAQAWVLRQLREHGVTLTQAVA